MIYTAYGTMESAYMETTIHFLRHGEVHNPQRILYGRLPRFGLSGKGRKKIYETAGELKKKGIRHIYASPLLRTRQTAGIVSEVIGVPVRISRFLLETGLSMQGVALEEFRTAFQPLMYTERFLKRGQESVQSQSARMMTFVRRVIRRHYGRQILAVSHGDPIVILKSTVEKVPFSTEYKMKNYIQTGEYVTLVYEGDSLRFVK